MPAKGRGTPGYQGPRYGRSHRLRRLRWVPLVEAGLVRCARCGELIQPDEKWDLGHDDVDPRVLHGTRARARESGDDVASTCAERVAAVAVAGGSG